MRKALLAAALATFGSAAMAANADYFLKVEGVSRPSASGPIYLKVTSTGDLDGDGIPDEGVVRLNCTGSVIAAAAFHYNVKSPRDAASGMASGKRTHHPVTFVKKWGPSTPQFRTMQIGYQVKPAAKAGTAAQSEGWTQIELSGAEGLCPVAIDAVKAHKSRSNIQNN
jgi:hypothetical protein